MRFVGFGIAAGVCVSVVGCGSADTVDTSLPRPTASMFATDWRTPTPYDPLPQYRPPPPAYHPAPSYPYPPTHTYPQNPRPAPPDPRPVEPDPPKPAPNPRGRDFDNDWLPNAAAETRRRRDPGIWQYVVIHHSDSDRGNAAAIKAYHVKHNGWKDLGYDFVIGNGSLSGDGEVEVGGRWSRQDDGAHAGVEKYNKLGIGICLVGDLEQHAPTAAQMRSLARLVKFLCERYGIPRDRKHVIGHGETGRATKCPGTKFNFTDLMRRL